LEPFALREGATAHAVNMPRRITPLRDLAALWRLYRALRTIRPHVVHAHTPKGGLLGTLAAWLARVPVRIYTIHGLPMMTARGCKRLLMRWTERISCWCATQVLAVSDSIGEVAVAERLCPRAKLAVLLRGSINGVDAAGRLDPQKWGPKYRQAVCQRHGIPEDALVAGFVGRIVRDKGMRELAQAWQTLRVRFPTLHLLLVGGFEPQDPVPRDADVLLRNDPRVHLAGEVEVADIPPYYTAMDVCVLPSYREGLPTVPLEAAAMRVPVVATRIPGCVDAVADGETGTLVDVYDAAALAEAVARYLADPQLRRAHGEAGRQRVLQDFRPATIWKAMYQQYVSLLRERGLPASVERRAA
jgi:glycosyltransferase involved in cell wall biosynthesis